MHGHIGHGQDAIAAKLVNKKLVCYAGQQDDDVKCECDHCDDDDMMGL